MESQIERKPLMKVSMKGRNLSIVDAREITFTPGQQTGRHTHPCPVVGYIAAGTARMQIEGEAAQELPAGSAFFEPADTVIASFDNASATQPMIFVAFYLEDGEQHMIHMLSSDALQ
jgi:quercetin dioxygenase-like cupin family protein